MTITLLGPQRFRASARAAVRALEVDGPLAVVNAGWQEREADDGELNEVLEGRVCNLRLHQRWEELLAGDAEYAEAVRTHDLLLDEHRALYLLRLGHAVEAADAVWRRSESERLRSPALDDAIEAVRALDAWHLGVVAELEAEFEAARRPAERPGIARHRAEVDELVGRAVALVLPGGHVGVLLRCLNTFLPQPPAALPVVAWSAGAMAVAERVVLFGDISSQGPRHTEVYRRGLGLYHGLVPLPHARRRLRLGDPERVTAMARRFHPDRCLVLDDGVQVPLAAGNGLPAGVPVLSIDGQVVTVGRL